VCVCVCVCVFLLVVFVNMTYIRGLYYISYQKFIMRPLLREPRP